MYPDAVPHTPALLVLRYLQENNFAGAAQHGLEARILRLILLGPAVLVAVSGRMIVGPIPAVPVREVLAVE